MRAIVALIERRRAALRGEAGMTLVELMVALSLLLLVLGIFFSSLFVVQSAVARQSARTNSNDQARLAVEELDREIRSGNVLYDPSLLPPTPIGGPQSTDLVPYMQLLVYTQTDATTLDPGNRCVQWLIDGQQQLVVRSWSVTWQTDGTVTGWRVVADHIVNRTLSPTVPAFTLASTTGLYGGRLVNIDVVTQDTSYQGSPVSILDSVEGRNTQYGYPANICQQVPPYPSSYPPG